MTGACLSLMTRTDVELVHERCGGWRRMAALLVAGVARHTALLPPCPAPQAFRISRTPIRHTLWFQRKYGSNDYFAAMQCRKNLHRAISKKLNP
jgi:hypothetical protein